MFTLRYHGSPKTAVYDDAKTMRTSKPEEGMREIRRKRRLCKQKNRYISRVLLRGRSMNTILAYNER